MFVERLYYPSQSLFFCCKCCYRSIFSVVGTSCKVKCDWLTTQTQNSKAKKQCLLFDVVAASVVFKSMGAKALLELANRIDQSVNASVLKNQELFWPNLPCPFCHVQLSQSQRTEALHSRTGRSGQPHLCNRASETRPSGFLPFTQRKFNLPGIW